MICKGCGEEFDIESYDVCPFCLLPWQNRDPELTASEGVTDILFETENRTVQPVEESDTIVNEEYIIRKDVTDEHSSGEIHESIVINWHW